MRKPPPKRRMQFQFEVCDQCGANFFNSIYARPQCYCCRPRGRPRRDQLPPWADKHTTALQNTLARSYRRGDVPAQSLRIIPPQRRTRRGVDQLPPINPSWLKHQLRTREK